MILRSFIISALVVLAPISGAQTTPVGVLVGIHTHGNDSAFSARPSAGGSLRTVWIPLDPSSRFGRASPRRPARRPPATVAGRDGARAGRGCDHFWAAPVGSRPQVHLSEPEERVGSCRTPRPRCQNDNRTIVYWVWPEYVSLDMSERSECGVHPDGTPAYTVRSLDLLDQPRTITDVLGASAEAPFRNAWQVAERQFRAASANQCEPDPFESDSWYIERKDGRWRTMGWNKAHRLCGYGFDFEADLDLSKVAGRTDDPSRWKQIKTRIPQIVDAHFSPAGPWVLVATDGQLMILPGPESNKPIVTMPLSKSEKMVMVEWATGRNVSGWTDEVRRIRAAARPDPVVR